MKFLVFVEILTIQSEKKYLSFSSYLPQNNMLDQLKKMKIKGLSWWKWVYWQLKFSL
jgi:hypothetical protein